jgi:hypothetical protein
LAQAAAQSMSLEVLLIAALMPGWRLVRSGHEAAVRSPLFVFVRRYRLSGVAGYLAQTAAERDFRVLRKYGKGRRRDAVKVGLVLIVAAFFGAASWGAATALLAVLAVVAAWLWLYGLGYVAAAGTEGRGRLPRLVLPGLSRPARDSLAVRIFWYSTLGARLAITAVITVVFQVLATVTAPKGDERAGDFVGVVALVFFSPALIRVILQISERWRPFDRVVAEACLLLDPKAAAATPVAGGRRHDKPVEDPLGRQRRDLAVLAGHLTDAARILDARQLRGTTPHPLSTLLRAASQYTRRFLTSERSLGGSIPDDLSQVLQSVALMLAMPREAVGRQILLRHTEAFDSDGNPAIEPEARPPGRVAVAAGRVARAIATVVAPVTNLATIAAIIGVLVLLALHRLDILDVLHFLRGT